jgi:hypothetical protein
MDWSWRKGGAYGAIVVDIERGEVVDVSPDRSAAVTANWLNSTRGSTTPDSAFSTRCSASCEHRGRISTGQERADRMLEQRSN